MSVTSARVEHPHDPDIAVTTEPTHAPALLFAYYNATAGELGHPAWKSPQDLPAYFRVDHDDPTAYYAAPGAYFTVLRAGRPVAGVGVHVLGGVADTIEVKRLYVDPAARGLGLARLLLDRLHAHGRALGATRSVLDCLPQRTGAIALYRSIGYRDIPPYLDDHGPVPLSCLQLDL